MIRRKLLDHLLKTLKRFPAVGITGPRQVGKTTLVKALGKEFRRVHLDLERPSDRAKLEDPELFLSAHKDDLVILDEIQKMPELFEVLRTSIDDDRKPGRFLILGSASPELLRQSSETLAGRIRYHELTPFLVLELEDEEHEDVQRLWTRGAFPPSYLAGSDEESMEWREHFLRSYTERELPDLGFPADPVKAHRLLSMIASMQGQPWNAEAFSKALELSAPRINSYRHFLQRSYLIRELIPWHTNLKKRMVKSPKVYIRDSGLCHSLLGLGDHDALLGHAMCGFTWEGFVIEQILGICPSFYPYFVKTHHGAEIDLLMVKGERPFMAFEIKLSNAPKLPRGFTQLCEELDVPERYIVTPSSERYPVSEKIEVIGLRELLKELEAR